MASSAVRTALVPLAWLALAPACAVRRAPAHAELATVAAQGDALALADALEALIARGEDMPADREYAYAVVRRHDEDTVTATYARAVVTGRLVQQKGLLAANLVPAIERFARRSRELDPDFRDGAATRLLGTLYVIAPGTLLRHGDSETGLDLLEALAATRPDVLENHLRLAEAYVALGDPVPAEPHLCRCLAHASALRPDDQLLLARIAASAGPFACADQPSAAGR